MCQYLCRRCVTVRDTVLIVDDDDAVVDCLRMILEHFGWRVEVVRDVASAPPILRKVAPRLAAVFCDMQTGRGERNECAEDLFRSCSDVLKGMQIPFAVMSGTHIRSFVVDAEKYGMHAFPKPFDLLEVRDFLRRLVPADKWPVPEDALV